MRSGSLQCSQWQDALPRRVLKKLQQRASGNAPRATVRVQNPRVLEPWEYEEDTPEALGMASDEDREFFEHMEITVHGLGFDPPEWTPSGMPSLGPKAVKRITGNFRLPRMAGKQSTRARRPERGAEPWHLNPARHPKARKTP